jgi:hypothetical protein
VGIGYFAVITGAIAERFIERGQEENVEAVEARAPSDLGAQVTASRCTPANSSPNWKP